MLAILLGNAVLLYGLYALGWTPATVALLFWYEAGVIGIATLVKVAASLPGRAPGTKASIAYTRLPRAGSNSRVRSSVPRMEGWPSLPKFLLMYGLVLLAYGALLMLSLRGPELKPLIQEALAADGVRMAMAVIAGEHAWLYWREYLRGAVWQRSDPTFHFWKPFGLALRAYLAFFFGFLILGWLENPLVVLTALIVLKTLAELFNSLVDAQVGAWQRVEEVP